jgi:hypothetical protein
VASKPRRHRWRGFVASRRALRISGPSTEHRRKRPENGRSGRHYNECGPTKGSSGDRRRGGAGGDLTACPVGRGHLRSDQRGSPDHRQLHPVGAGHRGPGPWCRGHSPARAPIGGGHGGRRRAGLVIPFARHSFDPVSPPANAVLAAVIIVAAAIPILLAGSGRRRHGARTANNDSTCN